MLLSVVVHTYSLRWVVPAGIMLGSAPTFIGIWSGIRSLTAMLPQRFYTYADNKLYSAYQHLVLFFFNTYTGSKVHLYGDISALYGPKENVVFICNHQSTVDWVVADMLASAQGSVGCIRYILKDGLKFFPLYGFYFRQHSCIFVKKGGKFAQEKAERQLLSIKNSNIPVWMVIFPEGTRMNPELPDVIENSKQFAKDQGFEQLNNVLTPKLKAFQLGVKQLQGHLDAVYDITIAYSNTRDSKTGERLLAPGMPEFLVDCPDLHIQFDRIEIKDVPTDESQLKQWLFERFQQKDRLLSHFYSDKDDERGRFPGPSQILQIPTHKTVPSFLFFGSCLGVLLGTSLGRSVYWRVGLFGTLAGCLWMTIRS